MLIRALETPPVVNSMIVLSTNEAAPGGSFHSFAIKQTVVLRTMQAQVATVQNRMGTNCVSCTPLPCCLLFCPVGNS